MGWSGLFDGSPRGPYTSCLTSITHLPPRLITSGSILTLPFLFVPCPYIGELKAQPYLGGFHCLVLRIPWSSHKYISLDLFSPAYGAADFSRCDFECLGSPHLCSLVRFSFERPSCKANAISVANPPWILVCSAVFFRRVSRSALEGQIVRLQRSTLILLSPLELRLKTEHSNPL